MEKLLILQTSFAKNSKQIITSEELQQRYEIIAVDYSDILGFDGSLLLAHERAVNLNDIDKIWLEFDWELDDSHINYHHITRLIIAKYADKLVVNKQTFQKYHPEYDDKMFVANLLHFAGLAHPKTYLLSDDTKQASELRVVKKRFSGRARDVYLVRDIQDLEQKVLDHAQDYIVQEYINIAEELRVVVYRGRIAAAVRKSSKFKDGAVGRVYIIKEQYELDDAQTKICVATAEAIESELLGIDLAIDKAGNNWIVEFNIGASLREFQKVTGIDLITELLLS